MCKSYNYVLIKNISSKVKFHAQGVESFNNKLKLWIKEKSNQIRKMGVMSFYGLNTKEGILLMKFFYFLELNKFS